MFEYRIFTKHIVRPSVEDLNKLAEEGWELVQILSGNDCYHLYLKRKKRTYVDIGFDFGDKK